VVRIRATESQASLTPRQRRINLRGAFVVADPAAVAGKHILLIDDIFTTGATARSMAQVLMRSGAASVWVATLARALRAFDRPGAWHPVNRNQDLPGEREAVEQRRDSPEQDALGQDAFDHDPLIDKVKPARMHASHNQPSF
jgi:hypothetical protein